MEGDQGVYNHRWRIILKWTLKNSNGRIRIEFIWLRVESNGRHF
jgi:hypothetical protein